MAEEGREMIGVKRENRTERGNQKSPIYIEKILGSTSVPFQMI